MLSDDFLPGATGVGTHLQVISRHLAQRGHRVSIITTRRAGEPAQQDWHGVRVYRVATVKLFGFYQAVPSMRELKRVLAEVRPDIVHHHYLGMMVVRAFNRQQFEEERFDKANQDLNRVNLFINRIRLLYVTGCLC